MIPSSTKYLIIGAGIHGLSTAYHLALELKKRGHGSGKDILVIDKSGIGAGASGIACGVVRNNYFQPAMRELMAHSVEVWESDPKAYSYHPVGYMQISPEVMHSDVASIYEQQKAIDYPLEFVEGSEDSMSYMQGIFNDCQAKGITSVLQFLPVCLQCGVLPSLPLWNRDTTIAAHRAIQCMMASLLAMCSPMLDSSWSLSTLKVSRIVRPASSTRPLDWCSPRGGCSGVIAPPCFLAMASRTAIIAGSPPLLRMSLF